MNTFAAILGVTLAVVGVRGTFSEDDQSYLKSKRGLSVVPAPSLAPAAIPAQAYYAAAVNPYFGVTRAAYVPAAYLFPRPSAAYYPGTPTTAYAPAYPAPAYPATPASGYPAPAPAPSAATPASGYPAPAPAVPTYSVPAYSAALAAYPTAHLAGLARAPHLAYSYYG